MFFTDPARRLARMVDAAAAIQSPAAAAFWCAAIDAETDRIIAKASALTAAAIASPSRRSAARLEAYERAVVPELDRAADAVRLTCTMYFSDHPSVVAH
ncbi:hypothetical protein [Heyndrickxia sporothermodurans]